MNCSLAGQQHLAKIKTLKNRLDPGEMRSHIGGEALRVVISCFPYGAPSFRPKDLFRDRGTETLQVLIHLCSCPEATKLIRDDGPHALSLGVTRACQFLGQL